MWTNPTAETMATAPPKATGGLSFRLVFLTIRRHPIALLGLFLLAAAVGVTCWLFLPVPKKTAAVLFRIANRQPSHLKPVGPDSQVEQSAYRESQKSLVKLRTTLNAALDDKNVKSLRIYQEADPDPLTWLEENVAVDSRGGPDYMRITIEGDDEQELKTLVGAVAKAYIDAAHADDVGARKTQCETLDGKLKEVDKELDLHWKEIASLANTLGATDPESLDRLLSIRGQQLEEAVKENGTLAKQLAGADAELAAANRKLAAGIAAMMQALHGGALPKVQVSQAALDSYFAKDEVLQTLDLEVARAEAALVELEKGLDEMINPTAFAKARAAIQKAKAARDTDKQRKEGAIRRQMEWLEWERTAREDGARLAAARKAQVLAAGQQSEAKAKVADIEEKIRVFTTQRLQLEQSQRKIEQKEAIAAELSRSIERLRVEEDAPPRVTQLEKEPFIVTGIEGNRRLRYSILGAIAAFCLGVAGLVFWEFRSRRVTHADEVSLDLGARLIGTIPPLAAAGDGPAHAKNDLIEAVDTTRIMLMHGIPSDREVRVVMVTSALAGEGKTTLSGNLAISLTRAGFRTLLVDGDTHAPTAHNLFDLPATPGFAELLRDEAEAAGAIHASPIPGLSILPAGRWTAATHQMLVGNRWRQLKRELQERFDFVVIDTSPLLLVSDTMLMAREVDGVVLSVLLGVSQVSRVAETVHRLKAVGANLAGVVVNNVHNPAATHAYAYRSRYAWPGGRAAVLPQTGLVEEEKFAEELDNQPAKG